jgi:hypothetical protein
MDYVVCPDDGEHLRADLPRPDSSARLIVRCPQCGRVFAFTGGTLEPISDPEAR